MDVQHNSDLKKHKHFYCNLRRIIIKNVSNPNFLGSVFFNYFCSKVGFNLTEALQVAAGTATLTHFAISSVVLIAFLPIRLSQMIP